MRCFPCATLRELSHLRVSLWGNLFWCDKYFLWICSERTLDHIENAKLNNSNPSSIKSMKKGRTLWEYKAYWLVIRFYFSASRCSSLVWMATLFFTCPSSLFIVAHIPTGNVASQTTGLYWRPHWATLLDQLSFSECLAQNHFSRCQERSRIPTYFTRRPADLNQQPLKQHAIPQSVPT